MPAEVVIPAPVGGWNARDALAQMQPTDAVQLINWVPGNGIVQGRGGSVTIFDGLGDPVDTMAEFALADGSATFLVVAYGDTVAATSNISIAPVSIGSGFTSARWQTAIFNDRLVMVNGADDPQVYDGLALTPMTITSGPTGTDLIGVVNFKGRAFYWENHSTSFWYAEAGSFQGVLSEFPFGNFVQKGGYLQQIISWTRDAGDGVDDYCAFVFSTGETLIYQGDDPSIVNQWSMIGRFQIGVPLGVRAHARFASTEIILTNDGFVGLDEAIQNARTQMVDTFGGRIVRAAQQAAQQYGSNFGWQALYYPRGNLFLANVPLSATEFEQYVKNTNTGAWCKFTGWPIRSMTLYQERLYFGTQDGRIVLADVTSADTNTRAYSDDGNPIVYDCLTAYQTFGQPGLKSQLTAARVVMNVFDSAALSLNSFVDYCPRSLPPLATPIEQTVGQWDVSDWDEDYWAGPGDLDPASLQARPFFRPITGFGFAIAMSVRYQSLVQNVAWYSTTFVYKQAGVN
jgi:hypothetical protein